MTFVRDPDQLVETVADRFARNPRLTVLLAAHITALNSLDDAAFRLALSRADAAYIDGISWVFLSQISGEPAHKMATTDMSPLLLRAMSRRLGRAVRVAVIGGERTSRLGRSVADAASDQLAAALPVEIVFTSHGFHENWRPILEQVRTARPDFILVGMGMPVEALWVERHRDLLPPSVVVTCGGWLRIVAGLEKRAPAWMQRTNLEWLHRLVGDPRRTGARYSRGVVAVGRYAAVATMARARRLEATRRP